MSAATADLSSALEILLHPLVVMSIADHYTRKAMEQPPPSPPSSRVFGLLFGEQAGVLVNVLETVEMAYSRDAQGKIEVQQAALEADMKLCQTPTHPPLPVHCSTTARTIPLLIRLVPSAVAWLRVAVSSSYPSYECLGWYGTGSQVEPEDVDTHRLVSSRTAPSPHPATPPSPASSFSPHHSLVPTAQMQKYNERPLYLMLDPALSTSSRDLPLSLYEESVQSVHSVSSSPSPPDFSRLPFTVHADEAERITSFHCAKLSQLPPNTSHVIPHYSTLHNAVASLHQRLILIHTFLTDTTQQRIPMDHSVLREVKALMRRLPVGEGEVRERAVVSEYTDSLLMVELGLVTRLLEEVAEMTDKFSVVRTGLTEGRGGQQRGKRGASGLSDLLGLTD